jgi:hypothetical protein
LGVFRRLAWSYYERRRRITAGETAAPTVAVVLPSKVHPSRNLRLRDGTFRPPDRLVYQPDRTLPPAVFVPTVAVVLPSKVHPSRNLRLRDGTFRPPDRLVYQPKRVLPPAVFVAGILVVISKVHPSRNPRLRDKTFRPPWLAVYQPQHVGVFTLQIVSTGLTEILFKGMWRGMYKRMR